MAVARVAGSIHVAANAEIISLVVEILVLVVAIITLILQLR